VTGAALRMTWHHFFVPGAIFRQMDWKNRKTHWYKAALNFPFLKDVSQNCFVFDVVNFKANRKSRRSASFLMLSNAKIEEVSLTCYVFDVVKFKN